MKDQMKSKYLKNLPKRVLGLALMLVIWAPALAIARPVRQAEKSQVPAQKVNALPPTQYIPSHDYDTRNISIDLHFDWEKEQAIGTATITFAPLVVNLRSIELDAANMTFNSVKLTTGSALHFESDATRQKLRVDLDRGYQPADVISIVIDYHTNGHAKGSGLQGFGKGLTYIKPGPDDLFKRRQIWSQGETEFNHYWFPCYDHPNDFATTELTATVEKPYMVISNGKLINVKNNPDGTRTFHWKIEASHASYLTSIVVGEFTPIEQNYADIPVISYVYPDEVEEGQITVKRMAEMVKFFSEKTGVKYPYEKYAQTMVHNFPGGMENISATTQTDSMIHDARSEIDATSDSLQSHELAHQWFGDFVTTRSWTHGWLNESFATYFQAMWDEHSRGYDDFLYDDVKSNQDQYYQAWAQGNRRPIVTPNYEDKDRLFDTYFYPRGGAVLHMLRKTLGEENWWRAINHYLTKYPHQPVETEQFRIAVEEATGQSMDRFFDEWLYRMGHPVLRVTKSYDPGTKKLTLTVRQEQKPDPSSGYPQVDYFQMPVEVEVGSGNNTRIETIQLEPKAEQTFTFASDSEPQLVNFDYQGTLIKELHFDKPTNELVYQLAQDKDVLGRVWALNQLSARAKDKATADAEKQQIYATLASSLTADKFWGVRLEAATALNGINTPEVRTALVAEAKDPNARVRARAIATLGALKDPTLAPVFLEHLNDPSYATVRAAATGLGATKSPEAFDALTKLMETKSWRDTVKAAALGGLAGLGDKRALDLAMRLVGKDNQTPVRAAALNVIGTVGKDDPKSFDVVADVFTKAVETSTFQLIIPAGNALLSLGDQRAVTLLEDAAKKTEVPQLKGFLVQLQNRLKQAAQAAPAKPAT